MAQSLSVVGEEPVGEAPLELGVRMGSGGEKFGLELFVMTVLSVVSKLVGTIGSVIIGSAVDDPDAGAVEPSDWPRAVGTVDPGLMTLADCMTF